MPAPWTSYAIAGFAALSITGCGANHRSHSGDDASIGGDAHVADGHAPGDSIRQDAPGLHHDAGRDASSTPDAFPSVLDVRIDCHNDCTLIAHPPSIAVTAGTSFQVNWINVGDTTCDVTKVDQFNHVPIVLGLDPGTSYDDTVHQWCGALFTGTFEFQISICTLPSYIPVNCGA